jgi:hypothetical protein
MRINYKQHKFLSLLCFCLTGLFSAQLAAQNYKVTGSIAPSAPVSGNLFGGQVSLNGYNAIMSSPNDNSNKGSAYFANWNGTSWSGTAIAPSGLANNDYFGTSSAIFGDQAAVSMNGWSKSTTMRGAVFMYAKNNGSWVQGQTINPWQRTGLTATFANAIAMDNSVMAVACSEFDSLTTNSGAVYIYEKTGNSWGFKTLLRPSDLGLESRFGVSVAVRNNTIVVGATGGISPNNTAVYVFTKQNGKWIQTQKLAPQSGNDFGAYLSLGQDALAVSCKTGQGSVYFYQKSGGFTLNSVVNIPADSNNISSGVFPGVSISGNSAIIGLKGSVNGDGALYRVAFDGTTWKLGKKLVLPEFATSKTKGNPLTFALSGEHFLITNPGENVAGTPNVGKSYFYRSANLSSSDGLSDAFVDISWNSTLGCAAQVKNQLYVQLYDATESKELASFILDSASKYDVTSGTFRHSIKPAQLRRYELRLYEYGSGIPVCIDAMDTGSTKSFTKPVLQFHGSNVHSSEFGLLDSSDYTNAIRVYRNGKLIKLMGADETLYKDEYIFNDINSLENGKKYTYCFQGINNNNGDTTARACVEEKTIPVNFLITNERLLPFNQAKATQVSMTWHGLSEYVSSIDIVRDNIILATLSGNDSSYTDKKPVPGKAHIYNLVLRDGSKEIYKRTDTGSIRENGRIYGRITNNSKGFGLPDATVSISAVIDGKTYTYNAKTSATGTYSIDHVYYGESAVYTVTAKKGNISFDNNNSKLSLSLQSPIVLLDIRSNFTVTDKMTSPFTISNLKVAKNKSRDELVLSWNRSQTDTVFYRINRDNELLDIIFAKTGSSSAFTDASAEPGTEYMYTVTAYTLKGNKYFESQVSVKDTFPDLSSPSAFKATANSALALVRLSWNKGSRNRDGVELLRNGLLVHTASAADSTWTDLTGKNDSTYQYTARSFKILKGDNKVISAVSSSKTTYPALRPANTIFADSLFTDLSSISLGKEHTFVSIKWALTDTAQVSGNFDGFTIKRLDNTLWTQIGYVNKYASYEFTDINGIPGRNYSYKVEAFKKNMPSLSSPVSVSNINYPQIPAPYTFVLAGGEGFINLSWTRLAKAADGYRIVTGTDTFMAGANERQYRYVVNSTPSAKTFKIQAFRIINGKKYFSAEKTVTGSATTYTSGTQQAPTKFAASKTYSKHVRLSWEYPSFIVPTFMIYRNGNFLDSVNGQQRTYYDYSAQQHSSYVYQVMAKLGNNTSRKVGDIGKMVGSYMVSGSVRNKGSQKGIGNISVTLVSEDRLNPNLIPYLSTTVMTDQNGHYEIPLDLNTSYFSFAKFTVSVLENNLKTESNNISFTPSVNTLNYYVDFADVLQDDAVVPDTIAWPLMFKVTPDKQQQVNVLSWNIDNPNFSGFKIFRGAGEIADIKKGEPFEFTDKKGEPGYQYTYQIKAYWTVDGKTTESGRVTAYGIYPQIAAVGNLSAGNFSNFVKLQWSHESDLHTYYEIKRNNGITGITLTGGEMAFTDSTGTPGQQYKYVVTPVLVNDFGMFRGPEMSVSNIYPAVAKVEKLALVSAPNSVVLNWTNNSPLAGKFLVYRDGKLLASIINNKTPNQSYADFAGTPGKLHEYAVVAGYRRNGNDFTSAGASDIMQFPTLSVPTSFSANVSGFDKNVLTWQYNFKGVDKIELSRQITGVFPSGIRDNFRMLASFESVYSGGVQSFTYADENYAAQSSFTHQYTLVAKSTRDGVEYSSAPLVVNAGAASISAPFNLTASTTNSNYIDLKWEHASTSISDFQIFRDGGLIATLDGKTRNYQDLNLTDLGACSYSYTVMARRNISLSSGSFVFSSGQSAVAKGTTPERSFQHVLRSCDGANSRFGTSVDFDGTRAVVGLNGTNTLGKVYIYTFSGNTWTVEQTINDPDNSTTGGFGTSVAISGNRMIVGAPGWNGSGAVHVFLRNTTTGVWSLTNSYRGFSGEEAGKSVDISANYFTYGAPGVNSNRGAAYLYYLSGGSWSITASFGGSTTYERLGASVSITDAWWAFGMPYKTIGSYAGCGQVNAYRLSSGYPGAPKVLTGPGGPNQYFGYSIDIDGNSILVGEPGGDVNWGNAHYYGDLTATTPTRFDIWNTVSGQNASFYGCSVKLSGGRALIGSLYHNNASTQNGLAVLARITGSSFYVEKLLLPTPNLAYSMFGNSVAMYGDHILVGANGTDNSGSSYDNGAVHHFYNSAGTWLEDVPQNDLSSVKASDGTYANQALIEWVFTGNTSSISEFEIYRDNVLIGSESPSKTKFFDKEGVPGKKHVYRVMPVYNNGLTSTGKSDMGYSLGNGKVEGTVVTYAGGSPIRGATLKLIGSVGGDLVEYTTTSDVNGKYLFESVYYGEKANMNVIVSYPKHFFEKDTQSLKLEQTANSAFIPPFRDKTAFLLAGKVNRKDMACGMDSIKLVLDLYTSSGKSSSEVYTDKEGKYSFVIDPQSPNIRKYVLKISNDQTVPGNPNSPLKIHKFDMDSVVYSDMTALSASTETIKNITDNLGFKVKLDVAGTCGLLGSYKYNIRIKTDDGCFDKLVTTLPNGILQLELPPLNLKVSVESVSPNNINTIPISDYFKVRPHLLSLADLYRDTLVKALKNGVAIQEIKENFIYHKSPVISIAGALKYLCNRNDLPLILTKGDEYTFQLNVNETFGNISCGVNEGYLVVRNEGGSEPLLRIDYDAKKGAFGDYKFIASNPAIVSPYQRYLIIEYHTVSDGLLAELIQPMIILGTAAQPGNDIIVQNDGDGLQMPLYVLRDPPGDESYSFIESGSTFNRKFSMTDQNTGFMGGSGEVGFAFFGIGAEVKASFKGGGGSGRAADMEVTYSTSQRISTAESSDLNNADNTGNLVGDQGDVIVGTGISLGYGFSDEIYMDGDCDLRKRSLISVSPQGVTTTWVYTLSQIGKIIKDLEYTLADSNNTNVQFGDVTDTAVTRAKTRTLISNWKNVLDYHRKVSVPFVQLCNPANLQSLPEPFKSQASKWVANGFCGKIGTYSTIGGKQFFTLKPDVKWNDELITLYNKTQQAVRDLSDEGFQAEFPAGREFSQSRLDAIKIDAEYAAQYDADAKNFTFSGGTSIENQTSVEKSKSRSYIQNTFFESEIYAGLLGTTKITFSAGGGLGAIFLTGTPDPLVVENRIGLSAGYNFSFEQSTTNTSTEGKTVGYKLADNDIGDQFSVTVIRGIDPSHTPYFALTGGRSSCPNEPGTITRDQPKITLETPDGKGFNYVQQGIDPNTTVVFPLKLTNEAPAFFNEGRYYTLSMSYNSNANGAKVVSQGTTLGALNYTIYSGGSAYTNLYVSKGPSFYDYPDINISLSPTCAENNATGYDAYSKNMEVYFRHPCSNISIVEPGNNWVIRKVIAGSQNDPDEKMTIYLADYDLQNIPLQEVTLEYRRAGDINGWVPMGKISKAQLQAYYEQYKSTYKQPKYPFVWDIKGNTAIGDGDYEIRAYNTCGLEGFIFSNIISGKIDRSNIQLFGKPEPSDGIFSLGDPDISVTFNKNVDCNSITASNYKFRRKKDSSVVNMIHSCFGNKIIFQFTDPIASLDGEIIIAELVNVRDMNGNKQSSAVKWEFEISNNPVYWMPQQLNVEVYKGSRKNFIASLFNTGSFNRPFSLTSKSGSWLSGTSAVNYVPPVGTPVTVNINASNLPVGIYTDTLVANVTGFTKEYLVVKVNVVGQSPQWAPQTYEGNATVICNFDLDSLGALSTDTMDRIAAVIGSEVRGVANIIKTGNYYRAYIPVSGSSADIGKDIDFRIWDASTGREYDGHPRISMTYSANAVFGTTVTPQILDINTLKDSARYIPLKKGWNWLAFNTDPATTDIDNMLKSLSCSAGDIIKTQTGSASYSASKKSWIALSGGLSTLSSEDGYMLSLSKDDTLRISGVDARSTTTVLSKGWNLIGNISQSPQPIATAYQFFNLSNKAILKNDVQVAEYDSATKTWNGFTSLIPNKSYLLMNGKIGTVTKRSDDKDSLCNKFDVRSYEKSMNIFAIIKLDGTEMRNSTDKVRALVNGECRGQASLQYNAKLDRYVMDLMVYANNENETLTFKIIRANGQEYTMKFKDTFAQNGSFGHPDWPYIFTNGDVNYNSIDNISSEMGVHVYPNPFESGVKMAMVLNQPGQVKVKLYDMTGKVVNQTGSFLESGDHIMNLDQLDMLPKGIYILEITSASGTYRQKLIKM